MTRFGVKRGRGVAGKINLCEPLADIINQSE